MAEVYKPQEGESIRECVVPGDDGSGLPVCLQCDQVAYRVLTISTMDHQTRKVALCGRHFVKACIRYAELEKFSRRGMMG